MYVEKYFVEMSGTTDHHRKLYSYATYMKELFFFFHRFYFYNKLAHLERIYCYFQLFHQITIMNAMKFEREFFITLPK